MKSAAPAVSADGSTVYICDTNGNAFALDAATGTQKWTKPLGNQSAGIIVNGDEVIIAVKNKTKSVWFLNAADGKELKTLDLNMSKNGPTEMTGWVVAPDRKTAYIPLSGGNSNPAGSGMAKIDLSTRSVVKQELFADNDCYGPAMASNGLIVVGSKDGLVYGINSELEKVWSFNHAGATPVASSLNYSHICTNSVGQAFVVCGKSGAGHRVYVLNATDGTVASSYQYSTEKSSYSMCGGMFCDGVFYFGTAGSAAPGGEFFGKYVGGQNTFWGTPGGDICGSGCVQSPLL